MFQHRCMGGCALGTSQPSLEPESKAIPLKITIFLHDYKNTTRAMLRCKRVHDKFETE